MKCWHCNTELIWGGDHDCEEDDPYVFVTNLSCPNCKSFVEVYFPKETHEKCFGEKEEDDNTKSTVPTTE
jgi:hypothetical protein|tara:strand:+ start:1148 stop:1357 length:210 start_codon:yes stop_codon:yes gene_type:complete